MRSKKIIASLKNIKKTSLILIYAPILAVLVSGYALFFMPSISVNNQEDSFLYVREDTQDVQVVLDSLQAHNQLWCTLTLHIIDWMWDIKYLSGRYQLYDGMTNYSLIKMVRHGLQTPVTIVLTPCRSKNDLAKKLTSKLRLAPEQLLYCLDDNSLMQEYGFPGDLVLAMFIPDSYEVYWNASAKSLLNRIHEAHTNFWTNSRLRQARVLALTPYQVQVLASIVEAETNKAAEKSRIAGLYMNRLNKRMYLQADPTVAFAYDYTINRVLLDNLSIKSPYNTYRHRGLPPGPINTPSKPSIDAVLYLEHHNYIFMCAREDFSGYHAFAETGRQHYENARRYQRELNRRKIYY